ncbi:MAG: hypothetical protein ACFB0C_14310 [Leptolyngbyaceae cyanobacterium]
MVKDLWPNAMAGKSTKQVVGLGKPAFTLPVGAIGDAGADPCSGGASHSAGDGQS